LIKGFDQRFNGFEQKSFDDIFQLIQLRIGVVFTFTNQLWLKNEIIQLSLTNRATHLRKQFLLT